MIELIKEVFSTLTNLVIFAGVGFLASYLLVVMHIALPAMILGGIAMVLLLTLSRYFGCSCNYW
jgi:putative effector of murein hydrolase LrgA (UPF0299 family)